MPLTKAQQIKGLKKALKNRKTPRAFIPSMKKRLAKLTGAAVLILAMLGCLARPAAAQTPVLIQPTQQTLATNVPCTGTPQTFAVNNRNQTQHYAYAHANSTITNLTMVIQGVDPAGNVYPISDTSTTALPNTGSNSALSGSGYFPKVQVVVTCLPVTTGIFSLSYSGSQATTNVNVGSYLLSQQDKTISSNAAANSNYLVAVTTTPFGNSYGVLYFQFAGTGPSGSYLQVVCATANGTGPSTYRFDLATTTTIEQPFVVPPGPCPNATVAYITGGASSATYDLDYVYLQPGASTPNLTNHITGTTATSIKSGAGVLANLVIGTPAAGTVSLFDLPVASCTGTPSSNVISVITVTTSTPPPVPFNAGFVNGICLKASAAMDLTVVYQ